MIPSWIFRQHNINSRLWKTPRHLRSGPLDPKTPDERRRGSGIVHGGLRTALIAAEELSSSSPATSSSPSLTTSSSLSSANRLAARPFFVVPAEALQGSRSGQSLTLSLVGSSHHTLASAISASLTLSLASISAKRDLMSAASFSAAFRFFCCSSTMAVKVSVMSL